MNRLQNRLSLLGTFFLTIFVLSVAVGILILILSGLLYLTQSAVGLLGYQYELSDGVKTAVVSICGVIGAAILAFYGVRSQNISAESRHRIDKDLDLRKDIFLDVAEAYAINFKILLKAALPDAENNNSENLIECEKAFFKLHMVCSEQTISKMLTANEEWAKALFTIRMYIKNQEESDAINNLIYAMEQAMPFLQKVAEFNTVARADLNSSFQSNSDYMQIVMGSFERIPDYLREIKRANSKNVDVR